MSEQETELDKLKRENDELRSLVGRAFPLVTGLIEARIQSPQHVSEAGASAWLRDARSAGCTPALKVARSALKGPGDAE